MKNLAIPSPVRYNKNYSERQSLYQQNFFDRPFYPKGAKAIRTAGSNAENGNFVALLNFYKLAD